MNRILLRRLALLALMLPGAASRATAQDVQDIPTGGTELVPANALSSAIFWGGSGTTSLQLVTVAGPDFTQAAEIDIVEPAAEIWDGQLQIDLTQAVAAGDVALLHFWMRTTVSGDESGTGSVLALVEENGGGYDKSASSVATSGSAWRPFYIPFDFVDSYAV